MTTVSSTAELDPVKVAVFWDLVRETVLLLGGEEKVFDSYLTEHKKRPDQEQLLTYHADPLAIAVVLVLNTNDELTDDHVAGYAQLRQKFCWE